MQKEVNKSIEILKQGGLLLYPTDTSWGIGCDATNITAVTKLKALKQLKDNTALYCLVADERMLKRYVKAIPAAALSILEISDHATTIIYDEAQNIASNLMLDDGSIAMNIPDDDFCYDLSRRLNGPIVFTAAHIHGKAIPKSFKEIAPVILKGVDYVVNLHRDKISAKSAAIIKLSNTGVVKIIRA